MEDFLRHEYVISYPKTSYRILSGSPAKYPPIDGEALAVVEAVRHFDSYLYGRHFTIFVAGRVQPQVQ